MEQLELFEKVKFNPEANYQWKHDDQFIISGSEFEILNNGLTMLFNSSSPTPAVHVILHEGFKAIMNVLKRNVENGKILEVEVKG